MNKLPQDAHILDRIVAKKKLEIAASKKRISSIRLEESELFSRECYSLKEFTQGADSTGIIAEFKRASPSKGIINHHSTIKNTTEGYVWAGATALSVLTDSDFFGGSYIDLITARKYSKIPILRKDFMLDEYQLLEAKAWGADIILLIATILHPDEIIKMAALAKSLGLGVLLEVHNQRELERSLCDDLDAVGINNRNLNDFSVSLDHSYKLVSMIPDQFLKVSESGISNPKTIRELKEAGFTNFLIGESFMKEDDPAKAMEQFVSQIYGSDE
ncbi:MAG: indole-3-glycerol phosphate synthase TrpC [Flavobacterium sp.]|nr:indole-3-glycerol phosphate synthase TrpC [Pedobacter sp.]